MVGMNSRLSQITDWKAMAKLAHYSPKQLASRCKTSLRQLERYFNRTLAISPKKWLNQIRQQRAKELIQAGCFVKQVAAHLDYKQATHFSREFKRHHGVTPTEFVDHESDGVLRQPRQYSDCSKAAIATLFCTIGDFINLLV
jgi:AraC-like DNA-binding protein